MSVNLLIRRTCSLCQNFSASSISPVNARGSATQKIKRFYRNVNIQQCTGQQNLNTQMVDQLELGCNRDPNVTKFSLSFNVLLDERVLKTPSGTKVTLNSEALALSVANEWMAQHEYILPATMHFTSLVNTCTDNPLKSDSDQIIANIVDQLEDDCVLVQEDSNSELFELQQNSLAPILKWFNSEFSTNIAPSRNLLQTKASESDKLKVEAYLKTHSFETLMGLKFCMDAIKSVVLSLAAFKQLINCDSAVQLSRLEEEFQVSKWGSVEWAHDWSRLDTLTRFSAGILFATHCSELHFYK